MRYGFNNGALLFFIGSMYLDKVRENTAKGIDAHGRPFTPYAPIKDFPRDDDGNIKRDSQGRWGKREVVRKHNDRVVLRSLQDVKPGQHMMDNLSISPWPLSPSTRSITIKATGGRGGVGHALRANTASGYLSGEPDTRREFLGHLNQTEMTRIVASAEKSMWGFLDKEGPRLKEAWRDVAKKRAARTRKQAQRRAKAAERSAEQLTRDRARRLKALNIKPGESAKQAWKRSKSKRRKRRRDRRQINKDFA